MISFRMDWLDLLAVQGTLKSLLQHHSSKASILWHPAFFIVQLSPPYMTTGKTISLTRRTFAGKVMSLLFHMLSRLVITFLLRSKHLLISWLQSPSAVTWEPKILSQALYPHLFGLAAPRQMGSSWTKDQIHVSHIDWHVNSLPLSYQGSPKPPNFIEQKLLCNKFLRDLEN